MSLLAVVEFPDDNSVEVVPTKWINFKNQTCQYKDGPACANLRRNFNSTPQPEQPTYRVIVKAQYDEFLKASKACNKLQYTSQLESSDSSDSEIDLKRRVRSRNPKVIFTPDETHSYRKAPSKIQSVKKQKLFSEEISNSSCSTSLLEITGLPPIFSSSTKGSDVPDRTDDAQRQSFQLVAMNLEEAIPTDLQAQGELFSSDVNEEALDLESVSNDSQLGFLSHEKNSSHQLSTPAHNLPPQQASSFLLEFRRFQDALFRELNEIKEDIRISKSALNKSDSFWSCPITVPINSENHLAEAEVLLSSEATRIQLQNWCEVLGGTDYKHHVRRALNRIFTQEFSLQVNLTGNSSKEKKKIAFKGMRLCTAVIGAVTNTNNITEDIVEKTVGKWFRGSCDRNGGRMNRQQ